MTEEKQGKSEWEPKPGDTVVVLSGRWNPTATERKVARLTATQIILEPMYEGASPERYRRKAEPSYGGGEYPTFEKIGRGYESGRFYHPKSQRVLNVAAGQERQKRINAVLGAHDLFRRDRSTETAQKAVEALQEFIRYEEDASKG